MSLALAEFVEKLVPISDFSQGKSGKIFNDVFENDSEYIVLKNNIPTAVIVSVQEYKKYQEKIAKFEKLMELIENHRLLTIANSRNVDDADDFYEFLKSEGMSISELEELADTVEIE